MRFLTLAPVMENSYTLVPKYAYLDRKKEKV